VRPEATVSNVTRQDMVDVPSTKDVLQKGLTVFENIGIVEPEMGAEISSIPQANGSSGDVGPLHLPQSPFQKLLHPVERLLKKKPAYRGWVGGRKIV